MKKLSSFFVFLVIAHGLLAQPAAKQQVSEKMAALVDAYAGEKKFNGAVLVAQKGEVLLQTARGFRDAEQKVAHDAGSVFQVGSLTKQFTAAVIMQLVQEKKLSLQDRLEKFFPGFTNGDRITIEHLLTHTSGIYNYTNDTTVMRGDVTRAYSQKEMVDLFRSYKSDFEPGNGWNYSNSAYSLLGYIIANVTGKSYEQNVRERILTPLGMTSSGFDYTHLRAANKSQGYFSLASAKPVTAPIVDSTIAYAAGSLYSTVGDLYKWERAIYTNTILPQTTWKQVFTPYRNKYGYGWIIDSAFGKQITAHSGGIHGFASYIFRFPEEEQVVIAIDNSSSRDLSKMARSLAAIALDQPYELPAVKKQVDLATSVLQQYVGEYQLAPTFSITVTLDGNQLKGQATGQPVFELFPEKENLFFLKVVDAKVEFVKDETGKVTELILHQNGASPKGKKVK